MLSNGFNGASVFYLHIAWRIGGSFINTWVLHEDNIFLFKSWPPFI